MAKAGSFECFRKARKFNVVNLTKIIQNLLKICPPRENPRFAPDWMYKEDLIFLVLISFCCFYCCGKTCHEKSLSDDVHTCHIFESFLKLKTILNQKLFWFQNSY